MRVTPALWFFNAEGSQHSPLCFMFPDNGKSLVTPIQLVPALLPAAAVCERALISGAAPCACPSPASRRSGRARGQRSVCAYKPLAVGGGGIPGIALRAWGWRGERGPWAAHHLHAGPRGCFARRQLGVPVLVRAYVCQPDHLALGNMLITC